MQGFTTLFFIHDTVSQLRVSLGKWLWALLQPHFGLFFSTIVVGASTILPLLPFFRSSKVHNSLVFKIDSTKISHVTRIWFAWFLPYLACKDALPKINFSCSCAIMQSNYLVSLVASINLRMKFLASFPSSFQWASTQHKFQLHLRTSKWWLNGSYGALEQLWKCWRIFYWPRFKIPCSSTKLKILTQ